MRTQSSCVVRTIPLCTSLRMSGDHHHCHHVPKLSTPPCTSTHRTPHHSTHAVWPTHDTLNQSMPAEECHAALVLTLQHSLTKPRAHRQRWRSCLQTSLTGSEASSSTWRVSLASKAKRARWVGCMLPFKQLCPCMCERAISTKSLLHCHTWCLIPAHVLRGKSCVYAHCARDLLTCVLLRGELPPSWLFIYFFLVCFITGAVLGVKRRGDWYDTSHGS